MGKKNDNRIENLRCVTPKENINNPNTHNDEWRKNVTEAAKKRSQDPEWLRKNAETTRKSHNKPVLQFNKETGEVIKEWQCAADAWRETGINFKSISSCCNGRQKSAGGYVWRYA